MTDKGRKIAGAIIAAAGIIELVMAALEGTFSALTTGICFCLIGGLYFFDKKKDR